MDLMNLFLLFSFGICLTGAQNLPPTITVTPLSATSFNVTWTMTDSQNYTVTWTNLGNDMVDNATVAGNMTSYTVTGLSGMDNYNVIVIAHYLNGSEASNPDTVYGPPTVPMNIRFPDMDITGESFVVQWDAVDDTFPVNYAVRWYRGNDLIDMARVDGLSYTVTNLTANTSYTVTVVAVNTCCGQGQVSIVGMVMTNDEPPTSPTPTNTTTVITPSATPTSTPEGDSGAYRTSQSNVVIAVTACVISFIMTLIAV